MTIQLHLKEILTRRQTTDVVTSLDVTELLSNRKDILQLHPLQITLQADPQPGMVRVTGNCELPLTLSCSRCLTAFETKLDLPFFELFQMVEDAEDSNDIEDDEIHQIHGEKVDLTPYVEQTLVLGMPYVPICSSECKGLCPSCGVNRNEQACTCSTERIDPRLAGLKDFFNQQ
jgi:uncharacterized protein